MKVPSSRPDIASKDPYTISLHVLDDALVLVDPEENILRIPFADGGNTLTSIETPFDLPKDARSYKVYGVVGILEGVRENYLIVITRAQVLGTIFGFPVSVINQVACVRFDARKAQDILDAKVKAMASPAADSSDSEQSESEDDEATDRIVSAVAAQDTSISAPVASDNGSNGDRAELSPDVSLGQEAAAPVNKAKPLAFLLKTVAPKTNSNISNSSSSTTTSTSKLPLSEDIALDKKVVQQVTDLFSRSMFIYSPGFDITNSLQHAFEAESREVPGEPLWKKTDRRFWWNEHLLGRFMEKNLDSWIIPVMQGTMQIEECDIEGYAFDFVLISRRSRGRAGMRYQRRGVNEQGETANFVETEQIVVFYRDQTPHVASFVQTRGSIPIYWSQSPYSLHPIPVLDRTEDENNQAFAKHFADQEKLYGRQVAINLTELSGREAIVGAEYRRHVEHLGDPNIKYVEFDFHRETKGMKFENISKLSTSLRNDLAKTEYFWRAGEEPAYCKQNGVFRTNCMDCLDRTNVVQSAFGRVVLNLQLMRFGINEYPERGLKYYEDFERKFNHVWANNGDMISRMYAGTSALKGDFTRTGKRNFTGVMNDASNSLTRMYLNTVKDFWRQATIDYVLGYHKIEIFRHVPESAVMSAEPGIERRWAKIRTQAIETSAAITISEDETKLAGWTLLSPNEPHKRHAKTFEEKVVLLTAKALYVCSFNYKLEKVVQFKRIELGTLLSIQIGEYILSSATPASRDVNQNYGFLVYYDPKHALTRTNTGSILNQSMQDLTLEGGVMSLPSSTRTSSSSSDSSSSDSGSSDDDEKNDEKKKDPMFIAFKAMRYNVLGELAEEQDKTCKDQVHDITQVIAKACQHEGNDKFLYYKPIVSVEEAEDREGRFKTIGLKIIKAILK